MFSSAEEVAHHQSFSTKKGNFGYHACGSCLLIRVSSCDFGFLRKTHEHAHTVIVTEMIVTEMTETTGTEIGIVVIGIAVTGNAAIGIAATENGGETEIAVAIGTGATVTGIGSVTEIARTEIAQTDATEEIAAVATVIETATETVAIGTVIAAATGIVIETARIAVADEMPVMAVSRRKIWRIRHYARSMHILANCSSYSMFVYCYDRLAATLLYLSCRPCTS